MYAIVDASHRATRGMILVLVDDAETAAAMARELTRRSVTVVVRPLSAREVESARTAAPTNVYAVA